MAPLEKRFGRFTILYYSSPLDPPVLFDALARAVFVEGRGRGGIRVMEARGLKLVARKYVHGGLFRALTRDLFLKGERAASEADVMAHLLDRGFPTVRPFCVIVERLFLFKRFLLITYMEEGSVELLDHLRSCAGKERLRIARRLAELLWLMKRAGVYHPDFHLKNVLVARGNRLVFLDFDKARKRPVMDSDMKSMFLRLERFADKMVRQGRLEACDAEKAIFLRTYARLSGVDFAPEMKAAARRTSLRNRFGWLVESLLYGRPR